MGIILRPYQAKSIQQLRAYITQGHSRMILQGATGSGKTVIFSYIVKNASTNGKRCMVLTDRVELLEQAGGTFEKFGIIFENITAETRQVPAGAVMVAMVETIKRRAKHRLEFSMLMKSIDILIIDEAHKNTFNDIFQYLSDTCIVIGATATPIRAGKLTPLSDYFTALVTGPEIMQLVGLGYLSRPRYFGVSVDLSKIRIEKGEFSEADMEKLYGETKLFAGLKDNMSRHAAGKKTMIFCPSVASSKQVADELGCLHVDGTMSPGERHRILKEFENAPGAVISNCAITTTGYDCPDIDCIVLYRATTSLPLYLQMIGRGSRTTAAKDNFTVLDFGMNIQRFGYWHAERRWSLDAEPKKSRKNLDVFPVKFCPTCGAIVPQTARECEYCGHIWLVKEKDRVIAELTELTYKEVQERAAGGTVAEIEEIRQAKGYKVGWLLHKLSHREQFKEYAKLKGYKPQWADIQCKRYNIQ